MPRRNRLHRQGPTGPAPVRHGLGGAHSESGPRGEESERYLVRQVPAARATADYRCPGCDQVIPRGTAHVVVWRDDDVEAEGRRHWHSGCWRGRGERGLTRRWS